ncbi:serine/threonine-protein kinase/endoribonuclease ire-1-like [Xenia sp. Carnegie-2017]|uniref:serine/threonine-protein kinase/endoribonuclease ire-1-like n=1 Tax=Xenia sp. Carnegie-2017 TaxID=2897299 RepID=UPI001F043DCC|nr:serine/threonine-protein kinase/endoribonuclease ire-1-like [Xenia sp. Carnegie-2017]
MNGLKTYRTSSRKGTEHWIAPESYCKDEDKFDKGRYKRESDIMNAGMVAYYVATKGEHAFGSSVDRLKNLVNGKPVGLDKIKDLVLKDLLSWMLSLKPEDRPLAETALKHPYFLSDEEKFNLLCKVGDQPSIKTNGAHSSVAQILNADSSNWQSRMDGDVYKYFCTDEVNRRIVNYGSSWTECLRFIRNVGMHWNDRPRPRQQLFYKIGHPKHYFLSKFTDLLIRVHAAIRSNDEMKSII